ncbi:hypothetical protein QZH41_006077 [Actinostola sp. cb2023]|nr:hypothetical protein QZH41_006077 [Actinostola sp. cb2023]
MEKLRQFVTSPQEPKGRPFRPLISKPKPNQKIAIVGAGIGGLHMAYLLKKNGYNNVVVLEKENRVGGKIMSLNHRGYPHEMGACYLTPVYDQSVIPLAKELGIADDIVGNPSNLRAIWFDNTNTPTDLRQYALEHIYDLTGVRDPIDAVKTFIDATARYSIIHRKMFGKYKYGLMNKPFPKVLKQLKKPFLTFLKENDLLALVPVMTVGHTMQGYGHLDTVSSIYGMIWNTPEFLYAVAVSVATGVTGVTSMFRHGFMQITDKLAEHADVRLNVNINKIERNGKGVRIYFNKGKSVLFDYLIWSADAREALKVIKDVTPQEEAFRRLTNTWFTTTLFDSTEHCKTPKPIDVWLSNVFQKRESSVWSRRISKYSLDGGNCTTPADTSTDLSSVSYQMSSQMSATARILLGKRFQNHFDGFGAKNIEVIKRQTWNYFPRFSVNDMANGMLWKVADRQGARKTWFTGVSVVFESTKNIIEYNQLMMKRMQM